MMDMDVCHGDEELVAHADVDRDIREEDAASDGS